MSYDSFEFVSLSFQQMIVEHVFVYLVGKAKVEDAPLQILSIIFRYIASSWSELNSKSFWCFDFVVCVEEEVFDEGRYIIDNRNLRVGLQNFAYVLLINLSYMLSELLFNFDDSLTFWEVENRNFIFYFGHRLSTFLCLFYNF